MKLTKNIVSREEALKISPEYVRYAERTDFDSFDVVWDAFKNLKKGQEVLSYSDGVFVRCNVSSVNHNDIRAVDGPIVRIGNGEFTWRCDGSGYAFPIKRITG